jgi:hypothetical protein
MNVNDMTYMVWAQYFLLGLGALFQVMAGYKAWRNCDVSSSNYERTQADIRQKVVESATDGEVNPNPDTFSTTEYGDEKPDAQIRLGNLFKTEKLPFIQNFKFREKNPGQTLANF